jgi:hypothetical protein
MEQILQKKLQLVDILGPDLAYKSDIQNAMSDFLERYGL